MAAQTVTTNRLIKRRRREFDDIAVSHYFTPYFLRLQNERIPSTPLDLCSSEIHRRQAYYRVLEVLYKVQSFLESSGNSIFKEGTFTACGSIPERTKVGDIDEFDYQYVITLDDVEATRRVHPQTRSRDGPTSFGSKCFYELTRTGPDDQGVTLVARDIQDLFMADALEAVSGMNIESKKAGPAVKLVIQNDSVKDENLHYIIKIDLTFGIIADVRELFEESELTPLGVRLLHESKLKCHFVPSMDYWKVCFVETEQELMRRVCEGNERSLINEYLNMYGENSHYIKASCYRIVKCLRDDFSAKDEYGDSILQSYPFKVTFLDLALKDEEEGLKWTSRNLGKNVIRVLKEVEERGQGHRICSLFIRDDDVMPESDRSYLECTRILDELMRMHDRYFSGDTPSNPAIILIGLIAYVTHMMFFMAQASQSGDMPTMTSDSCSFANLHDRFYTDTEYLHYTPCIPKTALTGVMNGFEITLYLMQCFFLACTCLEHPSGIRLVSREQSTASEANRTASDCMKLAQILLQVIPGAFLLLQNYVEPQKKDQRIIPLVMTWARFVTVYPVISTSLRIQLNAFLSLFQGTDNIIIDCFFDIAIDRYVPVYVATTSLDMPKRWLRWLALLALTVLPIFFISIMSFSYIYIYLWFEMDKELQLPVSGFEGQICILVLIILSTFSALRVVVRILFVMAITYMYESGSFRDISLTELIIIVCVVCHLFGYLNSIRTYLLFQISILPECVTHIIHNVILCTLIIGGTLLLFGSVRVFSSFASNFDDINPVKVLPLMIQFVLVLSFAHYLIAVGLLLMSKAIRQHINKYGKLVIFSNIAAFIMTIILTCNFYNEFINKLYTLNLNHLHRRSEQRSFTIHRDIFDSNHEPGTMNRPWDVV